MSNTLATKQELEKAIELFLSPQTNFIHLTYQKRPFAKGDTIPLYHNFLYALLLLQQKEKESMQKGISIVEHLLHFQIKEGELQGCFPRYLHEYPFIERSFEIIDILLPLYWIYRDFHMIFPKEIKERLEDALKKGALYIYEKSYEKEHSYLLQIQIHSLLYALGSLLGQKEWEDAGEKQLLTILARGLNKSFGSTRHLSKMILFFELLDFKKFPMVNAFYQYLHHTWHSKMNAYTGCALNEHVYKDQQEPTLYHHYLQRKYSPKENYLFEADLMEVSLIKKEMPTQSQELKEKLSYTLYPFEIVDVKKENYAFSFFNLDQEKWEKRGGFYPLRILMDNSNSTPHSFALHMGSFCKIKALSEDSVLLVFEDQEDKELDISFYGNHFNQLQITREGQKSTMFDLSKEIFFKYDHFQIIMSFPNVSDKIYAQLCLGNKRSQLIQEFQETFDWHLYFRKIAELKKEPFEIKLQVVS